MERQLALATMSLLAAAAAAQEARSPLSAEALLVPVHGRSADPDGGQPGLWAAGPAYKARFHDGFAFYPVLGKG
jgi:hypothetical protein